MEVGFSRQNFTFTFSLGAVQGFLQLALWRHRWLDQIVWLGKCGGRHPARFKRNPREMGLYDHVRLNTRTHQHSLRDIQKKHKHTLLALLNTHTHVGAHFLKGHTDLRRCNPHPFVSAVDVRTWLEITDMNNSTGQKCFCVSQFDFVCLTSFLPHSRRR